MASGTIGATIKFKDITANIVKNGGNIQNFATGLAANKNKIISVIPLYNNDYYYATSGGFFEISIVSGATLGIRCAATDDWAIQLRVVYI